MNSFSMEWNAKWDWENLDIFSSKASESPKKLQAVEWGIGIDEGEGDIDAGSFNLSGGGGGGSGGSASDMGHNSSVKSSISASTDCSSKQGIKTSNFNFEAFGGLPRGVSDKKELPTTEVTGNSPSMEASVGSGEPLIGLKLGKRTYFENSCSGNNTKTTSSFSVVPGPSSTSTTKKTKSSSHSAPTPRCQVEGCNLDLSSGKDYHRKHRVCENHSKSSKVVVAGSERRFCQQCSRFHSLAEFDEKKRSCRRRLSDHNARRRKPQQETIQFNSTRLSSSLYDGRQQMSFVLDNGPLAQTRPAANSTWESTYSSKYEPTKGYLLKPEKARVIDGESNLPGFQLHHAVSMPNHDSNRLSLSKGNTSEVFDQGFKDSVFSSNVDVTAPDLRRALSLLSNNNSWAPSEPVSVSLQHHPTMHVNPTTSGMPHHAMMHTDTVPQGLPLASSVYWQAEHQSTDAHMHALAPNPNGNSHFHEIQLFKSPYVTSGFYSNPLN